MLLVWSKCYYWVGLGVFVSSDLSYRGTFWRVDNYDLHFDFSSLILASVKRQVEVVELGEIQKEYILVHARLELLNRNPQPSYMSGPTPSADETVGLLVIAGHFDSAVNVCRQFDMPLTAVFEGLASR